MWHMRRGNSMQEERHAQNGCARGRRKVTHVSRSHCQTGRYVRVFASFRLLVHVSVWSFDRLLAYWHASSCVVAQVETQPRAVKFLAVWLAVGIEWDGSLVPRTQVDPLYQLLMTDGYGALMEWYMVWENRSSRRKPNPLPRCSPQIPRILPWN
jgi:hypothetical protein